MASNYTILIVDDTPANIQVVGNTLSDYDYNLEYTTSGVEALKWLPNTPVDLILLDIMMPVMDGFEVCKRIRSNHKYDDIPIIFLTAKNDKNTLVEGLRVGGQDFISKPFYPEELVARVETHIQLRASKLQLKNVNAILEEKVLERTKKLDAANQKLLKLDEVKSQFLRIISHEIRTPLNCISGGINLLNAEELPEIATESIKMLNESSKRLDSFALKALDISHLQTKGADALRCEEADISKVIENIIETKTSQAIEKQLKIDLTQLSENSILNFDKDLIKKALNYIVDNAIKFARSDTTVKVIIEDNGDGIKLKVTNQGEPFPAHFNINEIYPFYGDQHIDNNPGLSLYLCKLIVLTHNGFINNGLDENGVFVEFALPHN